MASCGPSCCEGFCFHHTLMVNIKEIDASSVSAKWKMLHVSTHCLCYSLILRNGEEETMWNFTETPGRVCLRNVTSSLQHFSGLPGLYPKHGPAVWVATLHSFWNKQYQRHNLEVAIVEMRVAVSTGKDSQDWSTSSHFALAEVINTEYE